jgi:NAD(P)-dependent dehydrogenase (short-subunit alcohol dehydrogenase family)
MGDFTGVGGVVTGAGSGIGRAVALALAQKGAQVLAVDLNADSVQQTSLMAAGLEGRILPHVADVTVTSEIKRYVDRCVRECGNLSFFHNNAGVGGTHKSIIESDEGDWNRTLDIMLRSYFVALKHVLPVMKQQGRGSIVHTGSILSLKGSLNRSDYVTAKHGLLGLTKTAAAEVARDGIRINLICPGPVDTRLQSASEKMTSPDDPTIERRRLEQATPMGRYAQPEEIADLVVYLLSPGSSGYLTGAVIAVDGGLMAV